MGGAVLVRFKDGYEEEFGDVLSWKVEDGLLMVSHKGEKTSNVPLVDIRVFESVQDGGNGKKSDPKPVKALKAYPCQGGCGGEIAKSDSYYWVRPGGDVSKAEVRVCVNCQKAGVGQLRLDEGSA